MIALHELQVLIVEDWAEPKGLIKLENANNQRLKLLEEVGETSGAILKQKEKEIKDGIGDIFVVLVILAAQIKSPLDLTFAKREKMHPLFFLSTISRYSMEFENNIYFSTQYLNGLCESLGYDLTECANLAWNEIKDRTGSTVNGTFIKN